MVFLKPMTIFCNSAISRERRPYFSSSIIPTLKAIMSYVSNSKLSPKLISKQLTNAFELFRAEPSAMLEEVETLDLLI